MICGIRIVRWQPPSQEELLCLHCSGQPHPQVERTLSWVISRWSSPKKTIQLTNISQDTKYVVINRGGELVYRGWTSSLIRQVNIKKRFHFLNSVLWSAQLVMLQLIMVPGYDFTDLTQEMAYGRQEALSLPHFWRPLQIFSAGTVTTYHNSRSFFLQNFHFPFSLLGQAIGP